MGRCRGRLLRGFGIRGENEGDDVIVGGRTSQWQLCLVDDLKTVQD